MPRLIRCVASLLFIVAFSCTPLMQAQVAPASSNGPCCGEITPEGRRLLALLDSMDVEHHWLSHEHVDWVTGNPDRSSDYHGSDKATHCSAFAAAVGLKLGVYLLRPPDHQLTLLASAQGEWLASAEAQKAGWTAITDPARAQHLANLGAFVVVNFINPDHQKPGHIAVIRPSEKTAAQLAEDGPEVTQAGGTNYNDYIAAKAFVHHPGAWPSQVRYYAHPVAWTNVAAAAAPSAAAPSAAASTPDYSAFTHSYTLPYSHDVDFHLLKSLHVRASVNGGPVNSYEVDTGSVGIIVGADDVPNIAPDARPGQIIYSSSGVEQDGVWTTAIVRFPDALDENGKPHVVESRVEVLAVTKTVCHDMGPNSGHCRENEHPHPHMMGIGFGRGKDAAANPNNVFVSVNEMLAGTMRRGYIIQPGGIQLGLTAKNVASGFAFQRLQLREDIPIGGPKDWQTARGSYKVGTLPTVEADVLMDTGLTNMMMSSPQQTVLGDVPDGTPMTVYLPGGFSYSFKTGDIANPFTPRRVTWVAVKRNAYINTGLHALAGFDYLYDADGGYLGLRSRP